MDKLQYTIKQITPKEAESKEYDVVIVGSGVAGSTIAKELTKAGKSVLILEAGDEQGLSFRGFKKYVNNFYKSKKDDMNSPFLENKNAPMPKSLKEKPKEFLLCGSYDSGYLIQKGPQILNSTYSRVTGGTTVHFQANAMRMLPEDFKMKTKFRVGLDWPIDYDKLEPYYRKAEFEMGVSAEVEKQKFLEIKFPKNYVYPMHEIPPSNLDNIVADGLKGFKAKVNENYECEISIRTIPQARNGIPNAKYKNEEEIGYTPIYAVSVNQMEQGGRCQGNNNCMPICPVQAKYDARKTLVGASLNKIKDKNDKEKDLLDFLPRSVVTKVNKFANKEEIESVEFIHYEDIDVVPENIEENRYKVKGKIFVLAANAVENAKILLMSDNVANSSKLIGKNLMDHPYIMTRTLLPESKYGFAGTMRGTIATSGIEEIRGGEFRREQAGFRVDILNTGWFSKTGSPFSNVNDLVNDGKFGSDLRESIVKQVSNQLMFACMVEQLPDEKNYIEIDKEYRDALGIPRPIIHYDISEYTKKGLVSAHLISNQIFDYLGADECPEYSIKEVNHFTYKGKVYNFEGGEHYSGTHIMGFNSQSSVVNEFQQSWDNPNLFIAGLGSMPTLGTSNPTLTLSAICFMSAEKIIELLNQNRISNKNSKKNK